jgi:hypothetical protein
MSLGLVYFVFLPSMVTTPLAGAVAARLGTRPTFWSALALAGAGLPLVLLPSLAAVLAGLALVGVGTFFAQAAATGFVGRAATVDRGRRQRALPGELFLRRAGRQPGAGPGVRPTRLGRLRRRHRAGARAGGAPGGAAPADAGPPLSPGSAVGRAITTSRSPADG